MKSVREILTEHTIILATRDPVAAEGFTQVPNFILKSHDLSMGAKLTYAMFLAYAWNNDCCFPGQDKLAQDVGVSRQSTNTFIRELERKGFIEVKRRGLGKTNLYTIHFHVREKRKR